MDTILPGTINLDIQKSKLLFSEQDSSLLNEKTISDLNAHYTNGLSKYVEKIRVELITDIVKCQKIWEEFSDNESLFDLWEFRMFFHTAHKHTPYFIVIRKNETIVACLPLCYQESEKYYTWFGTDWQEGCHFFTTNPFFVPILLYFAPKPLNLYGIEEKDAISLPKFINIEKDEPNFYLDLKNKETLDDYLKTLNKKKRYNLRRDFKHIRQLYPKISTNKKQDFSSMVELTNIRFHKKGEETDFDQDPYVEDSFREITFSKNKRFLSKLISVSIGQNFAGIDITATYNKVYYALRGGNNTELFPGVGNYMNLIEITDAMSLGMEKIDFLQYNYGWKSSCFQQKPRYMFEAKQ